MNEESFKVGALTLIAFLWPIGGFVDILGGYSLAALSLCFVAIGIIRGWTIRGIKIANVQSVVLFLFVMSAIAGTIMIRDGQFKGIYLTLRVSAYFLLVVTIAGSGIAVTQLWYIIASFLVSITVIVFFSTLNYFDLYTLSILFEGSRSVDTSVYTEHGLSGPYDTRTVMSKYLCLALPVIFLYRKRAPNIEKIGILIASTLIYTAAILTLSRGLYVCLLFMLLCIVIHFVTSLKSVINIVPYLAIVLLSSLLIVQYNDRLYYGINEKLSRMSYQYVSSSDADMVRVYSVKKSLNGLVENPMGTGFSRIEVPVKNYEVNPHNTLVEMLRAAGLAGLLTYITIVATLIINVYNFGKSKYYYYITLSLFSWLIYGLTHATMATLIAWVFLGLLLSAHDNR